VPIWSELPGWALELIDGTPVAHLGLLDESGHPRVQPITFVRVEDHLWSAIDDKPKRTTPARIKRLRDDPRATITIDRYEDDWSRLAWVQVLGTIDVLDVRADILAALADRYPAYREVSPRGPLLRLTPKRVLHWRASG
jgi:PPOX class probable F420-dependent enzyme